MKQEGLVLHASWGRSPFSPSAAPLSRRQPFFAPSPFRARVDLTMGDEDDSKMDDSGGEKRFVVKKWCRPLLHSHASPRAGRHALPSCGRC